ncbi:MAG TPA: F0F1 ATP synthase subunit alpha [Lachnospiraceae bacterium]|nr:F0F1 ATP synthase subunit alpha [Lachnospiraceae bacterium]
MEPTKTTGALHAILRCVTPPDEEQLSKFTSFLQKKYNRQDVEIETVIEPAIHGGFILEIGSEQYDWSTSGRTRQFENRIDAAREEAARKRSDEDIMTILKGAVKDFQVLAEESEVGFVETAGDGIVLINGLSHVQYGEIVVFENGVKGMVQNITDDGIGAILFDEEGTIGEGSKVTGTGKRAGIPVSENYLGRVVNALGAPVDGGEPITSNEYRPIEEPAPGIIDRKSVSVPLETGILAIDSMFPIGRGQRELIIGDRQTGKTSIALDTILNQKGKNCICIYVAIGQKASTVASLVNTLKAHDALSYTCVMVSTAADPAPLQYIAPYAATSLGEYFMHRGQDVLIIYDDLSKHAVAYRALSLLLGRSPGREAYPGDVFYLHSRLLERASRLSDEKGGGSISALPIIETQDGDVSAYIPTNVISITDGQIFLESDLFFEGQRPAVNVGLSVSRVGGAAQTKAMKKAAGSLRIDLAQYREMEVFTQFSSDLDEATTNQLKQGKVLMELLKQPLGRPLSLSEEVITLVAGVGRKLMNVPPELVKDCQMELLSFFEKDHRDVCDTIDRTKDLTDDLKKTILSLTDTFLAGYAKEHPEILPEEKKDEAAVHPLETNAPGEESLKEEMTSGSNESRAR